MKEASSSKRTGLSARGRRIHLTTLGCSKNTYDSEVLSGQLGRHAVTQVDEPGDAEVIIINTCGFIDLAKQESIDAILEAEALKKADPEKRIVVCGCLSERYRSELQREMPSVDAFFGTEDYQNILSYLELGDAENQDFLYERRLLSTPPHYAYLKISEGCNHTCAFCAIPLMRGRHRSRPMDSLVEEARMLAARGVRELIIISQDTTFYGLDLYKTQKIVELLQQLEQIEPIRWIRLHYLYPTTVQDKLIDYMAGSEKVVPYLDMPVQHITDRMLKVMKRGGNSRRIHDIFQRARERIADLTLRTTFIVGHPGETESDFRALTEFMESLRFDRVGVFRYSHEENTAAHSLADLPDVVKSERYNRLMQLQQEISLERNRARIGGEQEVLIDEMDWNSLTAYGRTRGDSPEIDNDVILSSVDRPLRAGDFVTAKIEDASEYELYGKIRE